MPSFGMTGPILACIRLRRLRFLELGVVTVRYIMGPRAWPRPPPLSLPRPLLPLSSRPLSPRRNCSVKAQATAFIVDADKGYLLTAAHTFFRVIFENGRRKEMVFRDGCNDENCVILVSWEGG